MFLMHFNLNLQYRIDSKTMVESYRNMQVYQNKERQLCWTDSKLFVFK